MFLHNSSLLPLRRWARPLALGALLLTSFGVLLTGCSSKPTDGNTPTAPIAAGTGAAAPSGGGAALAPDAGAAKDTAVLKETAAEKDQTGK